MHSVGFLFEYFNFIIMVNDLFRLGKDQDAITQYQSYIHRLWRWAEPLRWLNEAVSSHQSSIIDSMDEGVQELAERVFVYFTRIYVHP